jgi:transposase
MYYLGIDWATDKHDLCLLDEAGIIVQQMKIEQSNARFNHFEALVNRYGATNIRLNIKRSDGLLVDWMVAQGWAVYVTPSIVVAHRRPRRSKSDPSDAYLLAYLLRLRDPDCRPLTRSSATVLHLRELARALDSTLTDQRRLANRLSYLLYQYFPAANRLFAHIECLICLAFLEAFPTPEAARALTRHKLKLFLKQQDYKFMDRLDFIYAQLQAPMPTAAVSAGYVAQVNILLPLLRQLHHTRSRLERELPALFMTHPEAAWWKGFPGARGPLTPARLLAWMGDDRSRFPNPETLQAIAGTAPVTRRSGKALHVEFRKACSHPLHKALDDFARQSVRYSAWAQEYLDKQMRQGHSKARAYRALANRWVKIIWTLWQRREGYNEAKHVANRAHQGGRKLKAS